MDFAYSEKVNALRKQVSDFMDRYIYPNERTYRDQVAAASNPHDHAPIVDELKAKARTAGLWNLFLPDEEYGAGLTNLEYAPLAEIMGRVSWASEVFNCAAPDTGNMEILAQFGTEEQKKQWLLPLLDGEMRSASLVLDVLDGVVRAVRGRDDLDPRLRLEEQTHSLGHDRQWIDDHHAEGDSLGEGRVVGGRGDRHRIHI